MAYSKTKMRLASRRNLDKTDVETVYGELVRVIGGTYYSGGVQQGPANGLLDYRNFAPNAGIKNAFKSSPNGVFGLQIPFGDRTSSPGTITIPSSGSIVLVNSLPPENVGISVLPTMTLIGWSVCYGKFAATFNVSYTLKVTRAGSVAFTNGPVVVAGVLTGDAPVGQTGLSFILAPRDLISITLSTVTAPSDMKNGMAVAWIKALHVQ